MQARATNQHQKDIKYKVKDMVWLSTKKQKDQVVIKKVEPQDDWSIQNKKNGGIVIPL